MAEGARAVSADPRVLWIARSLVVVGIVFAGLGLATFHAPTCTGGSPTAPAQCSSWEASQWWMIGGVLIAVPSALYLATQRMHERLRVRETTPGERV